MQTCAAVLVSGKLGTVLRYAVCGSDQRAMSRRLGVGGGAVVANMRKSDQREKCDAASSSLTFPQNKWKSCGCSTERW